MTRLPNSRLTLSGLVLAALLLAASPSQAATTTTTFGVTTTVVASCAVTASALAFASYSGTQVDGTTTINTTCSNTTPYNVGLSAGTSAGATVTTRRMTGPATSLLNYGLFTDAARTLNWGTTIGTDTVPGTGNGAAQALTVFGRVPGAQFVAPGAYADTITVTVTF